MCCKLVDTCCCCCVNNFCKIVNLDPPVVSETASLYLSFHCQKGNSFWCGNKESSLSVIVNVQLLDKHDEAFMMSEIIALIQLVISTQR